VGAGAWTDRVPCARFFGPVALPCTQLDLSGVSLLAAAPGHDDTAGSGLTQLALALARPEEEQALRRLSLADNDLDRTLVVGSAGRGGRASATLADALICSRLEVVDLRRTRLRAEDEAALALALLDAPTLTTLRCTPSWAAAAAAAAGADEAEAEAEAAGAAGAAEDYEAAAASATAAAGAAYLDANGDRELCGEVVCEGGEEDRAGEGEVTNVVALLWVQQLAAEHGARVAARRRCAAAAAAAAAA
jgi:hypothetical protein